VSESQTNDAEVNDAIAAAHRLLSRASSVTVLTGAGISTDSGIPDFRGPQGVWTKNPKAERTSTLSHYLNDPEVRELAWQSRMHSPAWDARPNAGHSALVSLEQQERLHTLVTQNIDELHQLAGSSPARVVEVHGTMQELLDRVRGGERDPRCVVCGGIVKSKTISFGQQLVEADLQRAFDAASAGDALLCVGTTLAVGPVNQMVPIARRAGRPIVIVNGEPTEMDSLATVVVRGSIGTVLPALVAPA
jgi:NAD-dependent deacetylase